ncbi:hypothetical protein L596_030120 [Steinernema carpocapsae]|uniref:Major facilitator superfamily (MFS) profile domain-containing protein n=1 Tax=Steinernema carpocapsae TaxID=34508 RepID=A0A4U5LRT1_STECR|nr:hypothetical protein L596_030120 [Steinernema carpocapsae]
MRINLGMAMVCMVNTTAVIEPEKLDFIPNTTFKDDVVCVRKVDSVSMANSGYHGSLLWTSSMQSLLFSATFYGSLITIIPSGYLADRFGPKLILILAVLVYSIPTLFTPFLATTDFYAFFFARVIMGLGEGFINPSIASMAARWFPVSERAAVANLYTSGNQLAGTIGGFASASLCSLNFLGGWPLIFYIFGSLGCLWCVVFMIVASSSPDKNKWISSHEKEHILTALSQNSRKISLSSVPWSSLFTSKALIVIYVAQFVFNCNVTIMQSFLPAYFRDILLLDLKSNGFFTAFPFITQLIAKNVYGHLSDHLTKNGILTPTTSAKVFQGIYSFGTAASFVGLALFVNCQTASLALILLGSYGVFFASGMTGFYISQISVAPKYTGIIISTSLFFGMIANVLSALAFGVLNPYGSEVEWQHVFLILVALNMFSGVLFMLFGSADQQEWAVVKRKKIRVFSVDAEKKQRSSLKQ